MNTLQSIYWPTVSMYVTAFICLGIFIFIVSFGVAELRAKSFKVKYEALKDFVNKSPVNKENFQSIYDLFTYDTYCYSDDDKDKVLHLWSKFKDKFKSYFPDGKNYVPFKCPYNEFGCKKLNTSGMTKIECPECEYYNNGVKSLKVTSSPDFLKERNIFSKPKVKKNKQAGYKMASSNL